MDLFFSFSLLPLTSLSLLYSFSRMSGTRERHSISDGHSQFEDETGSSQQTTRQWNIEDTSWDDTAIRVTASSSLTKTTRKQKKGGRRRSYKTAGRSLKQNVLINGFSDAEVRRGEKGKCRSDWLHWPNDRTIRWITMMITTTTCLQQQMQS